MTKIELNTDDLVTVPEAARLLGRPKITLYRWIEGKKLTAVSISGVYFVPRSEVERLKDESRCHPIRARRCWIEGERN